MAASKLLPELVVGASADRQANAYSCLGTARFMTGDLSGAAAAFEIAEQLAREATSSTQAVVLLRSSSMVLAEARFEVAETILEKALGLASISPSGALIGRIQIKRGNVAFRRGDFAIAAEHFGSAIDALPAKHYLLPVAAWNLMLAAYHLDSRQARSVLRFMKHHDLRCRRQVAKRLKKTVPACMICWAEGYLFGKLGNQRHAVRCLAWAANTLFELGAAREAALCALDLVSFEAGGFGKVFPIISALAADPATPALTRDAARLWLVSTGTDRGETLRNLLLHGKKAGVASD
ncbi:MAG: hypothetical protein HC897_06795 [Thermoanaerobaculia bacterium]|nr:hypothetical protein [Thermoanaerobaculia bacterium]